MENKIVSLKELFGEVKAIMTENGIRDNTVFVGSEIRQYNHIIGAVPEIEFKVSIFTGASSNIKTFFHKSPETLLSQIREMFIGWQAATEVIEDVSI